MEEKQEKVEQTPVPAKKDEKKKKKTESKQSITIKANKKGRHICGFLNLAKCVVVPFYWLLRPFKYFGNKKIADGAAVIVCNHYALLDVIYPACLTWEAVHIIAKKDIEKNAFFRWAAKNAKAITVNRDGNDVRALLDCFKCLKNGEKIVIFPEGTRNKTDAEMLPFKHGASIMAIKTKTPIIPVVIYERPKFFKCAHILVGDPIYFTEYFDRKLTDEDYLEADNKLREIMLDMRRKHKEELESKKNRKKK